MTYCDQNIERAADLLAGGQLVAIPTETVYGLAANGFDPRAVQEIFKVKNRPFYDPLILHTDHPDKIAAWGFVIPEKLAELAKKFWPGPLTLLLNKTSIVPDVVTAGLSRVAFRIPDHKLTLDLLHKLDFPLAAPSANPFGYVSPTTADHVLKHFDGKIAMVLDGGDCKVGLESTIVGEEDGFIVVYRLGGLSIEGIEGVVGKVVVRDSSSKPAAPGMLEKHYAPAKKVVVVESAQELLLHPRSGSAYILFSLQVKEVNKNYICHLSRESSLEEAARNFYQALRQWDADPTVHRIIVERMPDFGLGRAINDRLKRAVN